MKTEKRKQICDDPIGEQKNNKSANALPGDAGKKCTKSRFRQPVSLKPHDKVAIISPSSGMPFLFPWVYEQGLDRLRKIFQLEPIEFPTARQNPEFLSKNPKVRADDISKLRAKKLTITQILRTRLGKSGRDEKKKDLSVSL